MLECSTYIPKNEIKMNNKKDFIDRKTNSFIAIFDKFFDAIKQDAKSFFIVILVLTNIIIFYKYTNSLEVRLDEREIYSDRIIKEVKKQIRPEIDRNIEQRTQKIETKVDSASYSLEQLKEAVKRNIK